MKKQNSLLILFSAITLLAINSCDYIDPPYKQTNTGGGVDTTKSVRKILIEDYTGHTCPNCPLASSTLAYIADTLYKGQIIPVAVHAGFLANAQATGPFTYNFKTPEGDSWDAFFGISAVGLPKGMVNRIGFSTQSHILDYTAWGSTTASIINVPPDADIKITNSFDSISKTVTTSIVSKFLNSLAGTYKLCVIYTEDSMVHPQLFPPPTNVVNSYVHMHAMRGSFNSEWGETIATDPTEDYSVTKQYSKQLVADAVPKNCKVVAFIYNDATKEVVQADEKEVE